MAEDDRLRSGALSNAQLEQFIRDGFICIERAFPRELAEEGCAIMWRDIPLAHDPATWTKPVIRLLWYRGGSLLEGSEHDEQRDFSAWRVNVTSRGRALLMLFLFLMLARMMPQQG